MINYGLDGEKLDREEVKAAWSKIKTKIDRQKRVVFEFLLFDKIIKPPLESPVIEEPKIRELKNKCPICLAQEVIEKGKSEISEISGKLQRVGISTKRIFAYLVFEEPKA